MRGPLMAPVDFKEMAMSHVFAPYFPQYHMSNLRKAHVTIFLHFMSHVTKPSMLQVKFKKNP